ncbi:MAG: amino acid adenylation domain-containing protein, partial [Rhizonema sp. PD38]|nr:amino acid adenylation domain-containing protein [Rhizonema sp. PD38]
NLRHFLKGEFTEELATEFTHEQIVAYCVCHQPAPTTTELRRFLHKKLPDYMIPAAFIMLDALPLTPNGKVDRLALPIPGKARPELEKAFVAPSTDVEKVLAEVWASVLGIEQVGIHDNFFELGGDSIRTIQLVAKAQVRGLSFSVQEVYQYQNIHKIAQSITLDKRSFLLTQKTEAFSLISEAERQKLPSHIEDAYPLARVQAGIIFHSQYSPDSLMYHDIFQYHLRVRLDMELLQKALQQLVERHPILRTSFDLTNYTEPLQLVHQNVFVPFQVEDLRSRELNIQQQAIATWIEAEKNQRFDLTHPPLIRFFIHRLTDDTFYLTFSCHNSILDGWSKASLLTELLHCYCAFLKGNLDYIESSPIILYRDFVALERKVLESSEYQIYWTQKLKDCVTTKLPRWSLTCLTIDKSQVGVLDVPISSQVSHGLKKLARRAEVPLKNVLLAAHLRVMSLLSGETDILTGLEANGRLEEADGEKTLGTQTNTLPLRLKLTGGTWIDLVQQAFAAEQELLAFRRYPYSDLQKLGGRQPLQPLVETVFNYTHFHVYQRLGDFEDLEILGGHGFGESNFAFRVEFNRNHISDHIQLDLECKLADISSAQLEAIGSYYNETLTTMATQPFERYEDKCLLSALEQYQLLVEWNDTATEYLQELCIHQQFEQQVQQIPDAIALIFENKQLSYRELNSRANALANYLQGVGVTPDMRVALCVERSLEMVVGILGILKAGGAYVPLDPTYPQEHLAYVLEDAQVSILLTQVRLVAELPINGTQILCLDSDWEIIAQKSSENPVCQAVIENLAYVIYTSGSTGQPKGVQVTHQNLVHSTLARIAYYQEPITNFLLIPSFAFDSSVAVIFWTLCQGGTLVLFKDSLQRDIWQLSKLIVQHQVSHWLSVPSLYSALLTHIEPIQLISLRTVIVAGESCSTELVERHCQLLPQIPLYNEYGPTEATVWSSVYNCQNHDLKTAVPIGRVIANTQMYVLNSYRQPVPIGVRGELYIGGFGLARGYLNRPELTAEKFIPNPFSNQPNARLYKTGDLACILPDGNIEFLGRIDHQVKLRGYRIELTAIEVALQEHPIVKEAVVSVRKDDSDSQRLIAYVVPDCKLTLKTEVLRSFLRQKLPEYMVPNTFVILDALPLTPNGKVDRQNLPAPEQVQYGDETMAQILSKLEVLSEEEVKAMLQRAKMQRR